jgi:hypothetical protein
MNLTADEGCSICDSGWGTCIREKLALFPVVHDQTNHHENNDDGQQHMPIEHVKILTLDKLSGVAKLSDPWGIFFIRVAFCAPLLLPCGPPNKSSAVCMCRLARNAFRERGIVPQIFQMLVHQGDKRQGTWAAGVEGNSALCLILCDPAHACESWSRRLRLHYGNPECVMSAYEGQQYVHPLRLPCRSAAKSLSSRQQTKGVRVAIGPSTGRVQFLVNLGPKK